MEFSHKIKYKIHNGLLDPTTGRVKFYDVIYKSILDAVKLENNLISHSEDTSTYMIKSARTFVSSK